MSTSKASGKDQLLLNTKFNDELIKIFETKQDGTPASYTEQLRERLRQMHALPELTLTPKTPSLPTVNIDVLIDDIFRRIEADQAIHRSSLEAVLRFHLKQ